MASATNLSATAGWPYAGRRSVRSLRPGLDDEGLLQRVADGDFEALSTIYDRNAAGARSLAHRMCDAESGDGAEQAVAQAFVAFASEARCGQVEGSIRRRLMQLTRRCALDRLNDRRDQAGDDPPSDLGDWRLVDLYERHVVDALRALTLAERECIELAHFDGLTVEQIAARNDMSQAVVASDLRTGLDAMVLYLKRCVEGEAGAGSAVAAW